LDLVLTGGRMNETGLGYLVGVYNASVDANGEAVALKEALKIFMAAPEFQATNANIQEEGDRVEEVSVPSQGRPYKAVVVLFMTGGCDSHSVLVPRANCPGSDLFQEYTDVRTLGAYPASELLDIAVPANNSQPCSTFGIQQNLTIYKELYDLDELAFVANVGALVEPMTKADYFGQSGVVKERPPSLFAHNIMQRSLQNLHAQQASAEGILGRMVEDVLSQDIPFASELYSLMGSTKIVESSAKNANLVDKDDGLKRFDQFSSLAHHIFNLTNGTSSSVFAETYSSLLNSALRQSESLGSLLETTALNVTFRTRKVSDQLQQVAKLIKLRDTIGTERAAFVVQSGSYDTHSTHDLTSLFTEVNEGLTDFVQEMKAQGVWDDVVILTTSDFARTLTSNGQGTDHAWGGQHIIAGGKVRGGQIFGKYPDKLTDDGDLIIGRGRVLPEMPWEGMWKGVAEWFGVEDMNKVLPNLANFNDSHLISEAQMFRS